MEEEKTTQTTEIPTAESVGKEIQQESKKDKSFTRDEVNKMIATEKDKAVKSAIAEYERLAKMTEAERVKEKMAQKVRERDEERKSFEAEKKAFEREKMTTQTEKELISKGLPSEFASFLVTDNAESTKKNLDTFDKMFRTAIETAVTNKLRGNNPPMTSITKVDNKTSTFNQKSWNKNK